MNASSKPRMSSDSLAIIADKLSRPLLHGLQPCPPHQGPRRPRRKEACTPSPARRGRFRRRRPQVRPSVTFPRAPFISGPGNSLPVFISAKRQRQKLPAKRQRSERNRNVSRIAERCAASPFFTKNPIPHHLFRQRRQALREQAQENAHKVEQAYAAAILGM